MSDTTARKVGIWGSYNHGNFGDDLMAEIFSMELRRLGMAPVVFSANPHVVSPGTATVSSSLSDWDDSTVILGGGAMLAGESLAAYWLRSASRVVAREFSELTAWGQRTGGRVLPISIGGDGAESATLFGDRNSFFKSELAPRGTVRLKDDRTLLKAQYHKDYEYYPDVLFATRRVLGEMSNSQPRSSPRVGVNLHEKRAEKAVESLRVVLGDTAELVPIKTHSDFFHGNYEWSPDSLPSVGYTSLAGFVGDLAGLDVIVSDKLHVGLVASTYGVPFISYQSKPKTTSLHHEVGASGASTTTPDALAHLVRRILDGSGPYTLADAIPDRGLDERARGHLSYMEKEILNAS